MTAGSKKIAIAGFSFEGNDFSPKVSGDAEFRTMAGADILTAARTTRSSLAGAVEVLEGQSNLVLVPLLVSQGGSGGTIEPGFYRRTADALLQGLRDNGPYDGVYLALHGAMVSPGVRDPEGELLEAVRGIVGPTVPVAASLDLHGNVTDRMVRHADILVGYENYPHDDAHETGMKAARLLCRTIDGTLKPVMRRAHRNFLLPVWGGTTREPDAPMYKVKALARSLEDETIVSTSYFVVQSWLDDDEAHCVGLAITNDAPDTAEKAASDILDRMWALRADFELPLVSVAEAVRRVRTIEARPVIFADASDCVGAGATGDGSLVLEGLLREAGDARCALVIVDPTVAKEAARAGIGATLATSIGYRLDPRFGQPVAITVEVVGLYDGKFIYRSGPAGGAQGDMGRTAVLRVRNILVVVASRGTYEFGTEQFAAVGIDTATCDILVLKNGMNFRSVLQTGMGWMMIDGKGSSSPDLANLDWKNRSRPFWPRDREG